MSSSLHTDEPISDRRLTVLSIVLLIGAMTSILDTTIVNVALDTLHTVFHASVADTQWVSSGYLLGLAGVIPLTGWASERFGTRTVWMTAVALFLLGSILCGFAWDLPALIFFRVLQGIGGGMILPVTLTILTQAAGPSRLARAMTAIVLPAQLAPILGPVIGGALVDAASWNWLFFVNIPLCVVALVLAAIYLPADVKDRGRRLDLPGFALLTPGLVALAYGISQAASGFEQPRAWLPIVIGVALVICFVAYSLRARGVPLIDVRLFARRAFGLSSVLTFAAGFSSFAAMFLLPLFYQQVRGETPFATGLLLIPQGLGTITFLLLNRRLPGIDVRIIVVGGIVLTMIGALPFALAGASGGEALLLVGQFVRGFGVGASTLPIMAVAFAGLARSEVPRASAAFSVVQRVGAPFGVTVVAVIFESYLSHAVAIGAPALGAFTATFWWIIAFSVVPLGLALLLPRPGKDAAPAPQLSPEPIPEA